MKSGKGFQELCSDLYKQPVYTRMANADHQGSPKYTALQVKGMFPPPMWEYKSIPWFLGLAVKISHSRDPQLTHCVADALGDIANLPVSHGGVEEEQGSKLRINSQSS